MADSPTSRTLAKLRKQGYRAQVVEKWVPQARRRIDLFGFIDVLAMKVPDEQGILGIQATTMENRTKRVKKIKEAPAAWEWLMAGNRLEVWCWRKLKVRRGKKAVRWKLHVTQFLMDHPGWEAA